MILRHLKQLDLSREDVEFLMEFACDSYEQPEKQNVTHCFDASGSEDVCEFDLEYCCRTCGNPDLDPRQLMIGEPLIWPKDKTEPSAEDIMTADYCEPCGYLTMVSQALRCPKCGLTLFLQDKDDEILGR